MLFARPQVVLVGAGHRPIGDLYGAGVGYARVPPGGEEAVITYTG